MHVRVRLCGGDTIIVCTSKLTKIEEIRNILEKRFEIPPKLQRLFYGGKMLQDGYTLYDYNLKINDVIQLMMLTPSPHLFEKTPKKVLGPSSTQDHVSSDTGEKTSLPDDKSTAEDDVTRNSDDITTTEEEDGEEKFYEDTESKYYVVGDLIDMKKSYGAWSEGVIERIMFDKKSPNKRKSITKDESLDHKSDEENQAPERKVVTPKGPLAKSFTPVKPLKKSNSNTSEDNVNSEMNLLFKIRMARLGEIYYVKINHIRPRARKTIEAGDIKIGQTVMLNYNVDDPCVLGHWYDAKVWKKEKYRRGYKLTCTIYLGRESLPQDDTLVTVRGKIYEIEKPIALAQQTEDSKTLMKTPTEIRPIALKCFRCRDDDERPCKYCGCSICASKESPDEILLCDECELGCHMACLDPPLTEVPEGDWYCPSCKRDPNEVVAPGAAVQAKKGKGNSSRDWGRGMACVGKTKDCSMPANHFGPLPGIEVGTNWRYRMQISESGAHRPPVSGIHGRDGEGAFSIVLSGGYEDDVDDGYEFIYTGSGGRDLSGNKRTAAHTKDQTLDRQNRALARNCAVKKVCQEGADAGDNWRNGKPVRVIRAAKMKHFPKYAPKEGFRYDGIYKVVKYYPATGLSGFRVWKYLLRRDDPSPAPWEEGAKVFPMIYPDGYLEAQQQKKELKKEKKVAKKRVTTGPKDGETTSNGKKKRTSKNQSKVVGQARQSKSPLPPKEENVLSQEEIDVINMDTCNKKLWTECIETGEKKGRWEFVDAVTRMFLCIICQETAVNPVTTPCLHNFCSNCLNLAFKKTKSKFCPCCRQDLSNAKLDPNKHLTTALRTILSGYDFGKK